MNTYGKRHAQLYNTFYADKPYVEEASFLNVLLQRFSSNPPKRLLELACGTGNHAFELERLGYEILATDISPDMLECANSRKLATGSNVDFQQMDMCDLGVTPAAYDAALALFDSIGYVQTNDAIRRVLKGVNRSLRPGGIFIFEFWHAAAMLRSFDPVRVRRMQNPDGHEVIRISETRINAKQATAEVTYTIFEASHQNGFNRYTEVQTNRFFLVSEMDCQLRSANFRPLAWFDGFADREAVNGDTWHVIAVARKEEGSVS